VADKETEIVPDKDGGIERVCVREVKTEEKCLMRKKNREEECKMRTEK
jgi:hypothetical protein